MNQVILARRKQIPKVIDSRKQIKDIFLSNKLIAKGALTEAQELFKPITDATLKTTEDLKNTIITTKDNRQEEAIIDKQEIDSQIKPDKLTFPFYTLSTNPLTPYRTPETRDSKFGKIPIYTFKSTKKEWPTAFTLFRKNGEDYLFNLDLRSAAPILLTDGLKEIFFNNDPDVNIIQLDDLKLWNSILEETGSNPQSFKQMRFYKNIANALRKEGESISSFPLPSDPEDIRKELILQLAANNAGHNKTFNHVNALLKQMLSKNMLTSKKYREILRSYFHI